MRPPSIPHPAWSCPSCSGTVSGFRPAWTFSPSSFFSLEEPPPQQLLTISPPESRPPEDPLLLAGDALYHDLQGLPFDLLESHHPGPVVGGVAQGLPVPGRVLVSSSIPEEGDLFHP